MAFKEFNTHFMLISFGCRKPNLQCKFLILNSNTPKKLFIEFKLFIIANIKHNFYVNSKSK